MHLSNSKADKLKSVKTFSTQHVIETKTIERGAIDWLDMYQNQEQFFFW